jgi:hypothetical protein
VCGSGTVRGLVIGNVVSFVTGTGVPEGGSRVGTVGFFGRKSVPLTEGGVRERHLEE